LNIYLCLIQNIQIYINICHLINIYFIQFHNKINKLKQKFNMFYKYYYIFNIILFLHHNIHQYINIYYLLVFYKIYSYNLNN